MRTLEIDLHGQIYPIYYYFKSGSGTIRGIPKHIDFNLDDFKTQSDFFISEFSNLFESSIKCDSQHEPTRNEENKI